VYGRKTATADPWSVIGMYIDIANMTLEEVGRICRSLSSARMEAYLTKVGGNAYLYTVDGAKYGGEVGGILSQI